MGRGTVPGSSTSSLGHTGLSTRPRPVVSVSRDTSPSPKEVFGLPLGTLKIPPDCTSLVSKATRLKCRHVFRDPSCPALSPFTDPSHLSRPVEKGKTPTLSPSSDPPEEKELGTTDVALSSVSES